MLDTLSEAQLKINQAAGEAAFRLNLEIGQVFQPIFWAGIGLYVMFLAYQKLFNGASGHDIWLIFRSYLSVLICAIIAYSLQEEVVFKQALGALTGLFQGISSAVVGKEDTHSILPLIKDVLQTLENQKTSGFWGNIKMGLIEVLVHILGFVLLLIYIAMASVSQTVVQIFASFFSVMVLAYAFSKTRWMIIAWLRAVFTYGLWMPMLVLIAKIGTSAVELIVTKQDVELDLDDLLSVAGVFLLVMILILQVPKLCGQIAKGAAQAANMAGNTLTEGLAAERIVHPSLAGQSHGKGAPAKAPFNPNL